MFARSDSWLKLSATSGDGIDQVAVLLVLLLLTRAIIKWLAW